MTGPRTFHPLGYNEPLLFMFVCFCVPYYGLYPAFFLVLQVSVLFRLGFPFSSSSAVLNDFGDLCCAVFIGASVHLDPSTREYTRTTYAR